MNSPPPPKDFEPHSRKSLFTDPWEPIYSHADKTQIRLGTWLRDAHCNSRGLVHGGFVSSIADNAMGLSCALALQQAERDFKSLVTINLSVDFTGMARLGQWFETDSQVIELTRTLGFVNSLINADGRIIARATSTFKIS